MALPSMQLVSTTALQFWSAVLLWVAFVTGVIAVGATLLSALLANEASGRVQRESDGQIATARTEAARAAEGAATLQGENLKLQRDVERERIQRLKLEAQVAPRQLTPGQAAILVKSLKGKVEKLFVVGRDEDEPRQYADRFISVLGKAGLLDTYVLTNSPTNRWSGIRLYVGEETDPAELSSDPLVIAFRNAGIPVVGVNGGSQSGVVIDPQLQRKQRTIYIGFKPLAE